MLLIHRLFAIPLWAAALAIPLALLMGVVAARVTGETDITPTKALGPATQLIYGALLPGHVAGNIMSANVTGGVGLHAADLLSDLKTGWLLGANPRKQFFAQLFGIVAGAAAVASAFRLLIPDAKVLGHEETSHAFDFSPGNTAHALRGPIVMAQTCEKCQGAAEPAARLRTFEYLGQTVRCLMLVSSCVVCGYQWEDEAYDLENANFAEQAQAAMLNRTPTAGKLFDSASSMR